MASRDNKTALQKIAQSRRYAEQLNRETRILAEDLQQQIQLIAEGATTVREHNRRPRNANHPSRATHVLMAGLVLAATVPGVDVSDDSSVVFTKKVDRGSTGSARLIRH